MKALTVGTATVDVITVVASHDIEKLTLQNATSSFLLIEQGRKIDAQTITQHIGGGAVNAGVSLARQGFEVSIFSKIGEDLNGEFISRFLNKNAIDDTSMIVDPNAPTAVAVMISSHDRNATIFVQRGANGLISHDDLPLDRLSEFDLVYIANLSNQSARVFPELVQSAKEAGALVANNPGIRQLEGHAGEFFAGFAYLDILTLNRVEFETLMRAIVAKGLLHDDGNSDLPMDVPCADWHVQLGSRILSIPQAVEKVQELGPSMVCVTDGVRGAYISDGVHRLHAQPEAVTVRGTAGAGDAFASTLIGQWANGVPLPQAANRALANSASVIQHTNTTSGLLHKAVIDAIS